MKTTFVSFMAGRKLYMYRSARVEVCYLKWKSAGYRRQGGVGVGGRGRSGWEEELFVQVRSSTHQVNNLTTFSHL